VTLVTLHGAIPVYVQVDTEDKTVTYVCASDGEFFYVSHRKEELGFPAGFTRQADDELPVAYDELGRTFTDEALIAKAQCIAESQEPEIGPDDYTDWPGWSWGW
jgi:hypothetical protein